MNLTMGRPQVEETLKDIILKLDPKLFKQVTSITTEEFEIMLDANLYNSSMLNTNIAKFKLVEDASLHYKGLTKHDPEYRRKFVPTHRSGPFPRATDSPGQLCRRRVAGHRLRIQ